MAVPSRSAWPLLALPLGIVIGCVGEPFNYHENASSRADAGAQAEDLSGSDGTPDSDPVAGDSDPVAGDSDPVAGDSDPAAADSDPVAAEPIANAPPDTIDVAIEVRDPAPPPSDGSPPLATTDTNVGGPASPSGSAPATGSASAPATGSASAAPTAMAPDVSTPPENVGGQGPTGDPRENADPPTPPCAECSPEMCGNGSLETGEECDDGNLVDDDACTNLCALPRCGDGIVSAGEDCDDGNTVDGDGCSADCRNEVCGDGQTTPNEQCDDGNQSAGDGCGPTCQDEFCGDGIVQSWSEQCDDGNDVDTDLCRNGCTNPASLNSLSSSCAFIDQITQTVCMVATANWCKQFGQDPIAGLVTGITGDNEYTVGCIVGFEQKEVATSKLDQCPGGRQQSPSCLEQVNIACSELGYDRGFYLGYGSSANTYAVACDYGTLSSASVPGCDGIADTSPVPITCAQSLSDSCGEGKGGMIQARAQWNQVTYACVDLSLTGNARQF